MMAQYKYLYTLRPLLLSGLLCFSVTAHALVVPPKTTRRTLERSVLPLQQWPNNKNYDVSTNSTNYSSNWFPPAPSAFNNNQQQQQQQQITDAVEKRVKFSAQSQVDVDRILKLFDDNQDYNIDNNNDNSSSADLLYDQEDLTVWSNFQIALSASLTAALAGVLLVWHKVTVGSAVLFVLVFGVANTETVSGAMARVLGRTTLQWSQSYTPKLKALARAVVTGEEEIQNLQQQIVALQQQVQELRQYKQQREAVDLYLNRFTVSELCDLSRRNGLPVSGTKSELLLRLIQYGILE